MIKIDPDPTFEADVEITIPGKLNTDKLTIIFRYQDRDELKAYRKQIKDMDDEKALALIIKGWSGIDTEFTKESLAKFLRKYPAAGYEIGRAYYQLSIDSRVKN